MWEILRGYDKGQCFLPFVTYTHFRPKNRWPGIVQAAALQMDVLQLYNCIDQRDKTSALLEHGLTDSITQDLAVPRHLEQESFVARQ